VLLQVPLFQDLRLFPSIHAVKPVFCDGFIVHALYSWIVQSCTLHKVYYNLHVLGLQCVSKRPAQCTDTDQPFSDIPNPRQKHRGPPRSALSLFYSKGNDVQIVTLLSEKESFFSTIATSYKTLKIPTKQEHNENQQLPLQQAFKHNLCVKSKQNKADTGFLYQQLYSCMSTCCTTLSFAKATVR